MSAKTKQTLAAKRPSEQTKIALGSVFADVLPYYDFLMLDMYFLF